MDKRLTVDDFEKTGLDEYCLVVDPASNVRIWVRNIPDRMKPGWVVSISGGQDWGIQVGRPYRDVVAALEGAELALRIVK